MSGKDGVGKCLNCGAGNLDYCYRAGCHSCNPTPLLHNASILVQEKKNETQQDRIDKQDPATQKSQDSEPGALESDSDVDDTPFWDAFELTQQCDEKGHDWPLAKDAQKIQCSRCGKYGKASVSVTMVP